LIAVLEVFNIFDFPNEVNVNQHPIAAYEKWSTPLTKFANDYGENKDEIGNSKYHRLRHLLKDGLTLYDRIRCDFRKFHNDAGASAGKMNIMEEASERRRTFEFPFGNLMGSKYRLTKGATFPILAAFRTYVEKNPRAEKSGDAADSSASSKYGKRWTKSRRRDFPIDPGRRPQSRSDRQESEALGKSVHAASSPATAGTSAGAPGKTAGQAEQIAPHGYSKQRSDAVC
jgi:hypothetical protein